MKKQCETISRWENFGYKDLFVLDYVFSITKNHLKIYQEISKEFPNVNFYVQTRADIVNKETINEFKKINIGFLWIGIESFSDQIQKIINKYKNVEQIVKAIDLLKKNEIPYGGFIQFGLPGESIKTINKNLYYIWKLKILYTMSVILHTPLYGTTTYKWAKEQYPWVGKNWSDISAIRGLIKNELTPSILMRLVKLMRRREVFEKENPPKL